MTEYYEVEGEGTPVWTEIEWTVLDPEHRAESAPVDTRTTPYLARARGTAVAPVVGQAAEIRTVTGRRLRGVVTAVNAGHGHGFGAPLPAWVRMQDRIRALVAATRAEAQAEGSERNAGD